VLGPGGGRQLKTFGRLGSVGIELAVSIVIGLGLGRWLDGKLETDPWLTIIGLLLGAAAGFKSLYETAKKAAASSNDADPGSSPPPDDD